MDHRPGSNALTLAAVFGMKLKPHVRRLDQDADRGREKRVPVRIVDLRLHAVCVRFQVAKRAAVRGRIIVSPLAAIDIEIHVVHGSRRS